LALKVRAPLLDNELLMSERGRKRRASSEQCAEVQRLAKEGMPIRRIAEVVFGDRSFRGRVERILQAGAITERADQDEITVAGLPASAETVPTIRAALSRYLLRIERGEVQPTVSDLVKLLDLERRLEAFESVERLNALTRALDEPMDAA
jgi:hypothetical protein